MKALIHFICIVLLGSAFVYGDDYSDNHDFLQLYRSNDRSVIVRKGNKCYLNPDKIVISSDGAIHLLSDQFGKISLPILLWDRDGVYTVSWCLYICNQCQTSYGTPQSSCPNIDSKTGEPCGSTSFTFSVLMPDYD